MHASACWLVKQLAHMQWGSWGRSLPLARNLSVAVFLRLTGTAVYRSATAVSKCKIRLRSVTACWVAGQIQCSGHGLKSSTILRSKIRAVKLHPVHSQSRVIKQLREAAPVALLEARAEHSQKGHLQERHSSLDHAYATCLRGAHSLHELLLRGQSQA